MSGVLTTCPYCGCGCNFVLQVAGGRVEGTSPVRGHPVSCGTLCVKGWNAHEYVHAPDRLNCPLVREDGRLAPAGWDRALDAAANGLKRIAADYAPDALVFLSSAKCTNEENFLMMKLARAAFGTNNVDHCARLCHASSVVGLAGTFGSGAMTNSIEELAGSDCIFVIGSNTTSQHPQVAARILASVRRGGTLLVADPRAIQLTRFAKIHIAQRPGTDVALINAMMHVIIAEDLHDRRFIAERTEGFEQLRALVEAYTPELAEKITGAPAESIVQAARCYARAPAAAIVYSMGITQHTTGTDNVRSLADLAMLTGNVGRPSTGVNPLRGQNNVQGACDLGALPNVFSGYQKVTDAEVRRKFAAAWSVGRLPGEVGLTVIEAMDAAAAGRVKAMYIMGENPMMSDPDLRKAKKALENLELLIVQDIFMTETARLADVVLPGASFAEKDGTFTNTERRVQRVRKAIEPIGGARADWQVLCEIARRAGYNGMRYSHPEEVFAEMAELTPSYAGMSYPRLEPWGLQWPCPDAGQGGTPYLHKDQFARGRGRFMPAKFKPPDESPDEQYDLILTTGRIYFHWHTGSLTRRTSPLSRESPEAFVEISPEDAGARGIKPGQAVRVATRRGSITLKARVTSDVAPGVIFIPFHFYEAAANLLTNPALDPEAKIPEYKVCAASVEACR
ncbi:MAG: formate dehydrogenase subunit alpha [Planctomycetota bacterium]|jgi:formate dehydrogenase alpha subunit